MRFLHLADLHLGKRMNGYSLLEDQKHFLFNIALKEAEKRGVKTIVIAGDIYDVINPSGDAVELLDSFFRECSNKGITVLAVPGNHDSAERLAYASSFLSASGIHIVTSIKGALSPIEVDGVAFYLLPFLRNVDFRELFGDREFSGLPERFAALLGEMKKSELPSVLVAHQAVSESNEVESSGSESVVIGTSQIIPAKLFAGFHYVALGHIHKSYKPSSNSRYAGSPLKYHIDEYNQKKTLTFVEVTKEKTEIEEVEFAPLHDLVRVEGTFQELMDQRNDRDYVIAAISDPELIPNVKDRLQKQAFPLLASVRSLALENKLKVKTLELSEEENPSLTVSFAKFYETITKNPLNEYQRGVVDKAEEAANKEEE